MDDATLTAGHSIKIDKEDFQLTSNERLIIRNYRAMKRTAQHAFVDLSEEFALALPAAGRLESSASSPH